MIKKIIPSSVIFSTVLLALPVQADISATVTAVSDYVYNGISQTDNSGALQGSVDWYNDAGFYVGVWGSKVDFNTGTNEEVELDYYAGYSNSINDSWDYDLGYIYYTYPGADDAGAEFDYGELYGSLTFNGNTTASLYYSDDYAGEVGDSVIIALSHSFELAGDYSLTLEASQTTLLDDAGEGYFRENDDSYNHWGVSVANNFSGFDVSLAYSDTNIKEDYWGDTADGRAVLAVSYSFE